MDYNYCAIINIRTLVMWEGITGKCFSNFDENNDNDILALKYAAFLTSQNIQRSFSHFKIVYGGFEFKKQFDLNFNLEFENFNTNGLGLVKQFGLFKIISIIADKYSIDYFTLASKLNFVEIKALMNNQ